MNHRKYKNRYLLKKETNQIYFLVEQTLNNVVFVCILTCTLSGYFLVKFNKVQCFLFYPEYLMKENRV